jgi:hypothetical protein
MVLPLPATFANVDHEGPASWPLERRGNLLTNHDEEQSALVRVPNSAVLTAETLRSSGGFAARVEQSPKSEDRLPMFWRVFGGTMLSIAALVGLTVYQQFTGSLYDLRKEINALHEARADLVKKDELNNRLTPMWAALKESQTAGGEIAALKERCTNLLDQLKTTDNDRKQLAAEVQKLRDRLVLLEGRLEPRPAVKSPPD